MEVEAAHLAVVAAFMDEAEVDGLTVVGLERAAERPLGAELAEGRCLNPLEVADALRHLLREDVWCRLETAERFYLHVGYDYYVYLGCDRPTPASLEYAGAMGLFVDADFPSPHWPEDD